MTSCILCGNEVRQNDDLVELRSCACQGRIVHARCWLGRVVMNRGVSCPCCDTVPLLRASSDAPTNDIDNPLGLRAIDETREVPHVEPVGLVGRFQHFLGSVERGVQCLIEQSKMPLVLDQRRTVAELKVEGVTPQALLAEVPDGSLLQQIAERTKMTAGNLAELGFTFTDLRQAGLSVATFPMFRARFGQEVYHALQLTLEQLWLLCSKDFDAFINLQLAGKDYEILCPRRYDDLVQRGMQKQHLRPMLGKTYELVSFEQLRDCLGLDVDTMVDTLNMSREDFVDLVDNSQEHSDHFETVFEVKLDTIPSRHQAVSAVGTRPPPYSIF